MNTKTKGWAKILKHMRNSRELRPLEPLIKEHEARLTAVEKALSELSKPKRRGRPPLKDKKMKDGV